MAHSSYTVPLTHTSVCCSSRIDRLASDPFARYFPTEFQHAFLSSPSAYFIRSLLLYNHFHWTVLTITEATWKTGEYFLCYKILPATWKIMVRDCSDDIATRYGLDGPGIEFRWGQDFSHLSRPALGGLPILLYNGYRVFPGGKAAGACR